MIRSVLIVFLSVLIASCGGGGGGGGGAVSIPNRAPTITDPGALSILEGASRIVSLGAEDADGDILSFSIISGDDQSLFTITSSGILSFAVAPDYELPTDVDTDNVYLLSVQVTDGALTDNQALTITITNAFEGRVVDAPISGASVFVDLNGNNIQDTGEPSGTTDANGYFNVDSFTLPTDGQAKVVSKGGIDTMTGKALPGLALVSDVPSDLTKPANVTPLTTVLSVATTPEAKAQVLAALGISGSVEELLTSDGWADAEAGNENAKANQRMNQQIGMLLQTATTLTDDGDESNDVSIALAESVASQISTTALAQGNIDLTASATIQSVLTDAAQDVTPTLIIETAVFAAVANATAMVNTVVADVTLDPLSDTAKEVIESAQNGLQASIVDVVLGDVSVASFAETTDASELFSNVTVAADAPDNDSDGISDVLDPDDDNDEVRDSADVFPLDSTETLDTDSDGTGNNADTDDDGDGVADGSDAFPLDASETLDTDSDGTGNNADTDDDGDGVADGSDAFPLDSTETIDTDSDGTGNNADTDDDGDGVADGSDAFPLDASETLDTDSDGTGNNADTDDDGDGVADGSDAFPLDSTETIDTDSDGTGNNADTDDDGDGVADDSDAFPLISIGDLTDTDGDGRPNICDSSCTQLGMTADTDDDGDGVADGSDAFPLISLGGRADTDADGLPNECDTACTELGMTADIDDDNDGVEDTRDPAPLDYSLTPPTAVIDTETTSGNAPLRVVFSANSSVAGNPEESSDIISSITWNSGDGATGSGSTFEYIYLTSGDYIISLTVTNSDGYSHVATYALSVSAVEGTLTIDGTISIPSAYVADSDVNDQDSTATSNDFTSLAQVISRSAVVSGYVNKPGSGEDGLSKISGDVYDIYKIKALGGEVINLISGDTANGDLDLLIANAAFSYIDWSLGSSTLYESVTLPAGADTYYIEVSAFSGASTYTLEIGGQQSLASHGWNADAEFAENELLVQENSSYTSSSLARSQQSLGVSRVTRAKSSDYKGPVLYTLNSSSTQSASSPTKRSGLSVSKSSASNSKLETLRKAKEMRGLKQFEYVEPNFIYKASAIPNDPGYPLQAWHYNQINMPDAWDRSTGMGTIKVAILDTGVMLNHPDLVNRVTSDGYDFVSSVSSSGDGDGVDADASDPGGGRDNSLCPSAERIASSFHGTHVAGTVGAQANDGIGVAGVNWNVDIMPIRVLGCGGYGASLDISEGILYAAGLPNYYGVLPNSAADIINLSLGGSGQDYFQHRAVEAAREAGVIVIAAAGNDALEGNPVSYPASYQGVVSVGATNPEGQRAVYSQYNSHVDIAAPGGSVTGGSQVVSTVGKIVGGVITPAIDKSSGTSMAAPHVAGVASLMKGIHPALTPDDFDLALALGIMTVDVGAVGKDDEYGYGLIDANKALQTAEGMASGISADFPPLLHLTTYAVDLGITGTQLDLQAINAGGGSLTITQVAASTNNISVVPPTNSSGLGEYAITVDRSGLTEGVYQGSVQFTSDAGVRTLTLNYEELSSSAADPDGGKIYNLLYNKTTETVDKQVSSVASSGQYSFSMDEINPAVYVLVSGSDIDNDGYICGAGEACAYWPSAEEPDYLIANQSFTGLTMKLRYETQVQVGASSISGAAIEGKKVQPPATCKNEISNGAQSNIKLSSCAKKMLRRSN
jgi:serine protease